MTAPGEQALAGAWDACLADPGAEPGSWFPAQVPGTIAGALRAAGLPAPADLDAFDCRFRTTFDADPPAAGEEVALRLGGIATVADVELNGERILASESMFLSHRVEVGSLLRDRNELVVTCRALNPLLAASRKPRARWRTSLANGNLRFFRTMLLGRCPGFAPGPAVAGPWRPVTLERCRGVVLEELSLRPRIEGDEGVIAVRAIVRAVEGPLPDALELETATGATTLAVVDGIVEGEAQFPRVRRWSPWTHGDPVLYDVRVRFGNDVLAERRVGFRALEPGPDYQVDRAPLAIRVNGNDVFARGAVWTPPDLVSLVPDAETLRRALERVRTAGMNMVRIPGTAAYEPAAFHDLCDELGLLVWQDFMFANYDYPIADETFRSLVEQEVRQELALLAGRPSLAVLCGGSEVEQQASMLGLAPSLGRGELFGELLPALIAESGVDAPYVPSAPSGGDLPFRPDMGVANYYGVGGYRRPLDDARRARVGFAAECLALANVPDDETLEEAGLGAAPIHHPRWKAGVPRDAGVGWDFDDVRDWYLEHLYGLDPSELRRTDPHRFLELSRAVGGEVMAEVFGEWRRGASPCAGGLVLWLHDFVAGAGWGLVDADGRAKAALQRLRSVLAPVAVWTTDEGLGGIDVHVANDRPEPLEAMLRVALYRDLERRVDEAVATIAVPAAGTLTTGVERLLGRFVDAAWAYRFGPPAHDVVVASLEHAGTHELLGQAFRFPAGFPLTPEPAERLGLEATVSRLSPTSVRVEVSSSRLAYCVRVNAARWQADDGAFSIEPGRSRAVVLATVENDTPFAGRVTAANLDGAVPVGETG